MTPDELQDYLESLPDKVEQDVADVLQEQARQLSDAQRAALQALEAAPDETGNLEASCRVETSPDDPLDVHVVAGGDLTTTEVRTGSGEPYDYALAFNFGSSHQPGREFFYSTYRARKDGMDSAISDAIGKAINDQ
jgi:HK97 gp10 family phage protein